MTKLFIPGPTNVNDQVLAAQARPMIGHRSAEFRELYARIQPGLREVFQTQNRVYLSASSGSGLFEGALRSVVGERLLLCVCGAFGQRWAEMAAANAFPHDVIDVAWREPNLSEQVEAALDQEEYDTLAVVHNETSTGVVNPVEEIARRARALNPELIIVVDAVSSAGGVEIQPDSWGLDVVVTSSQKCFALPPGLAFAVVSDRALARAETVEARGWYFDLLLLENYHLKDYTPATPAISLMYALDAQLEGMLEEGMPARWKRHADMAAMTREWAEDRFELFAAEGYRSDTVTAVSNTRSMDVSALNAYLAGHEMSLANGYGPLKEKTFRIGHMGETQPDEVAALLGHVDEFLRQ